MSSALDSLQQIADKIDAAIATFQITVQAVTEKINAVDPKDPTALEQIAAIQAEYKAARDTYVGIVKPAFDEMQTIINGLPADEKNAGQKIFNDVSTRNNISTEKAAAYTATKDTKKAEAQAAVDAKNKEVEDNAAKTPEQTDQQNKQYVASGAANDDKGGPTATNSNTPIADSSKSQATGMPAAVLPTVTIVGKADTPAAKTSKSAPNLRQNPLANLSSYTYQLSLYMITPDAYNAFVLSGRKDINAFRSALDSANQRTAANISTSNSSPTATLGSPPASSSKAPLTGGGAYLIAQSGGTGANQKRAPGLQNDFYIDDLKMTQAINAKSTLTTTNVTSMSFTITEPYGFSLITKLRDAGNSLLATTKTKNASDLKNPLKQMYILGIRFLGYDQNGNLVDSKNIPGTDGDPTANAFGLFERFYDIYFTKFKFKIEGKTVVYNIEAANIQNQPFGTKRGLVTSATTVIGETVYEALMGTSQGNSQNDPEMAKLLRQQAGSSGNKIGLLEKLNKDQKARVGVDIEIANEWDVSFIGGAETSIKLAKLASPNDKNKLRVGRSPDVTSTKTSHDGVANKTSDPNFNVRTITFNNGISILQAIDSIIKQSSYLEKALKVVNQANEELELGEGGTEKVKWYNISAQVEVLGWDTKVGDFAYRTTYVIQPYETPVVVSTYANKATPYYGPNKRYDYWFTGKNSEIISYQQEMDNTFFTVTLKSDGSPTSQGGAADIPTVNGQPTGLDRMGGENQGLEAENNYITSLYDPGSFAKAKLTIIGDPDYLMQTSASPIADLYNRYNGTDGFTINPNSGQTFIEINFKEPNDYNIGTGLLNINNNILFWEYPKDLKDKIQGISYMVVDVTSRFSKGKFEQDLTCILSTFGDPGTSDQTSAETNRLAAKNSTLAGNATAANESQAETNRLNRSSNASVPTNASGDGIPANTPLASFAPMSSGFLDPSQMGQAGMLGSVGSINNTLDPMQRLSQNQTITIPTKLGQTQDDDAGTATVFGRG